MCKAFSRAVKEIEYRPIPSAVFLDAGLMYTHSMWIEDEDTKYIDYCFIMYNVSVFFLFASDDKSERIHKFLGCTWVIPIGFVERGEDALSYNSWYATSLSTYKAIVFHRERFRRDAVPDKSHFIEEVKFSEWKLYGFSIEDPDFTYQIPMGVVEGNGDGYISFINLIREEIDEFISLCKLKTTKNM